MVTWCGPGWVCAAQDGFLYCKVLIYLRNKVLGQTMSAEGSHRRHEVTLKKNLDSDEASLCKGQTVHKLPMIQKTSVLFCPWREEKGEHPQSLSLRSLRCAQSPSWQPGYTEEGVYDCDVCVFFLFGFCPFELGISDLTAYLLLVTFACLIIVNGAFASHVFFYWAVTSVPLEEIEKQLWLSWTRCWCFTFVPEPN